MTLNRPKLPRSDSWNWAVDSALCTAATAASCLLYEHFFATNGYLSHLCVALLGGAVVALVAGRRGWRLTRSLLTAAGGFLLLACYEVLRYTSEYGLPGWRIAAELAQCVLGGWARMLTVALPADVRGDLLVTPMMITWFAAFASVTLALRGRSALVPVTPAVLAFVIALLFVGNQPGIQVVPTVMLLAAASVLVLLRANQSRSTPVDGSRPGAKRRLTFGVLVIVVSAGFAVTVGQTTVLATGEHRFDPRILRPPPLQLADTLSPLVTLKSQLTENPPRQLFTVRIDGNGAAIDRIRIAALDDFDGVLWSSSDRFLVAGHQLPVDPDLTTARPVSAHVTVTGLAGPFLPVIGWPTRLEELAGNANAVGVSDASGVLVTTQRSPRGLSYDLVGAVSSRDSGLALAESSNGPGFTHFTALPGLPPELAALAQQLTLAESTPYGKLTAIERYLRGLPYQLDSPPGQSYAAIHRLLIGGDPQDDEGYAEQHASAFAVLARALGFPTRVAVGYRLADSSTGIHVVTTRDVDAWPEVHFDGYGWIAFEPTDPANTAPRHTDHNGPQPQQVRPPQPNPPVVAQSQQTSGPDMLARPGTSRAGPLDGAALIVALLLSGGTFPAALIAAEKAWVRRRRRRATPRSARVLGAWWEAADRLRERGVTMPVSLTAQESAAHAIRVLGVATDTMTDLARLVTQAVFAQHQPDEYDVQWAWDLEEQLRQQLYPRRRIARWLLATVDPRPSWDRWRDALRRRAPSR